MEHLVKSGGCENDKMESINEMEINENSEHLDTNDKGSIANINMDLEIDEPNEVSPKNNNITDDNSLCETLISPKDIGDRLNCHKNENVNLSEINNDKETKNIKSLPEFESCANQARPVIHEITKKSGVSFESAFNLEMGSHHPNNLAFIGANTRSIPDKSDFDIHEPQAVYYEGYTVTNNIKDNCRQGDHIIYNIINNSIAFYLSVKLDIPRNSIYIYVLLINI